MKVLHGNDHYAWVGGAEAILFSVLEALEERGITNVVVHQHPTPVRESRRRLYQIPGVGEAMPTRAAAVAEAFREVLRIEQPDVIHLHDLGNPDIAELSAHYGPTVQSLYNHSVYCPGGMKYLPGLHRVCRRPFGAGCLVSAFVTHCNSIRPRVLTTSYRRSHRMMRSRHPVPFIVLSAYQAQCLVASGYPPDLVKVIAPCTELPPEPVPLASSEAPFVLFTGRIMLYKGLDRLLQALVRIPGPARLVVDGEGPALESAKALARALGVQDRVEFVGWAPRDQHVAYYRRDSVVVVPSVWPEPFGLVGIEAMSYGKPVVAFRVGGIPEWLEDGVTGYLVEPGDLRQLAARITQLLEQPATAQAMGAAGRRRVAETFTRQRYVSRLLQVYEDAVESHRWP